MTWRHNTSNVTSRRNANWHVHRRAFERGSDMRFPTMWYVRPAKTQISLRIQAVWSEPLLVAWILYVCYAIDWTSFRRLHRLVWVYTCQAVSLFLLLAYFSLSVHCTSDATYQTLRMSKIDLAKVLKQAITEILVMGRVARKPKVVAFQQQRRRPACADSQSDQRLCCSISGKYNW